MGTLDPDMGALVRAGMARRRHRVVCSERGGRRSTCAATAHVRGGPLRRRHVPRRRRRARHRRAARDRARRPRPGLPLGAFGGLLPDDRQQRRATASGPPATAASRSTGSAAVRVYVAARHARQQAGPGERARTSAGGDARFAGVVGTAITQFAPATCTRGRAAPGSTTEQATAGGLDVVVARHRVDDGERLHARAPRRSR